MLRKLLKYDMSSIRSVWLWLAGAAVLLSLPGAFCMRFLFTLDPNEAASGMGILQAISVLGVLASFMTLAAFLVVTEILIYWRFYKSFFTDEGYLTFTLPVTRAQLLLSKTLNACIWMASSIGVLLLCGLEFLLIAPPEFILDDLFAGLWKGIVESYGWLVVYLLELLLILAATLWMGVSIIHLCITIGSIIAKKLKILAAIGVYYLFNFVLSFAGQIIMVVGIISAVGAMDTVFAKVTEGEAFLFLALVLLIAAVIVATLAYFVHLITLNKIERKLNLA